MKIIRTATVPVSLKVLLKGQLRFLNYHFKVVGVSSNGPELLDISKNEGIRTIAVKMNRGISPLQDIISLFKLYLNFRKEKPIVVHSITPKAGLLSMLAGKMANVPIRMHTFTGLIFPTKTGLLKFILIKMDQLLCWSATHVYPEGKGVQADLQQYNITKKTLKVLANGNINGIDTAYFDDNNISISTKEGLRKELNLSSKDFIFIYVGRIVKDKGINELVNAFCKLNTKYNNIKLVLVGSLENNLNPISNETLSLLKSNSNIISVGYQSDVRPFFSISDVLTFPSYREGFPNVVLQAGAMGIPSIVTNINGSNEIIKQDINGSIIPAHDSISLEKEMQRFLNDKEYLNYLKSNSREIIIKSYDKSLVWNATLNEYNKLISEYLDRNK